MLKGREREKRQKVIRMNLSAWVKVKECWAKREQGL